MELTIELPFNKVDMLKKDLVIIDNVNAVVIKEKRLLPKNVLDRNPNYQLEIYEVLLNIVISIASEELYKYTKNKVIELIRERNIKIKQIKDRTN